VLSVGFSGGLEGPLAVGDLVLPSALIGLTRPGGPGMEPAVYRPDPAFLRTAEEALRAAGLRVMLGPTVTAPGILTLPADKEALARQTGALAVDMESYWVARAAAERGLPFLALRAISDVLGEILPPLAEMVDEDGRPRARQMAGHLI